MEVAALGLRVDGIDGIDRAATSLDRLADSGKQAGSSVANLGNQTKPAVRETEALSAAAQKAQIAEQRLAKAAADAGMSTKAMSAALRGVPAQFTDIAVSLQGGMSPLTVFLQQGGQLKDMFGGAGSAARALGGYVLGLVNPFTAAAAAVAALGVAYYQGSKEQDNFVKSIVTSGNASGVTTSQLRAYAQQIDEVVGTQAKAAESLAIFVAAGVRGDDQLRQFTETAIRWEKATGEGVDVVAGKFAALQKDPITAALKLNETTNFLTKSVYEQIVALDEQGKSAEASAIAMQALDGAMAEGATTIEKNLGSIERGWNAITGAAKGAWDAMLNIGRQVALMDRLANEQERLLKLETETVGLYERGTHAKRLADQRQRVSGLLEEVAAEEANAAGKKEAARQVAASAAWDKITNKNISDESKLRKELNDVRQKGIAAGAKESEILAVENKLREDFAKKNKKSGAGGASYGVSEIASIMARVKATNDYIKALQEQGTAADKITEGERLASKIQGEIDSGKLKSSQVIVKQRELEAAKMLQSAQEALKSLEAATQLEGNLKQQVFQLQKRTAYEQLSYQIQKEGLKLTDEQRGRLEGLATLIDMAAEAEKSKTAEIDRQNTQYQLQERLLASSQRFEQELSSFGQGSRAAKEAEERVSLQQRQNKELRDMAQQHGQELRAAETEDQRKHLQSMYAERLALTQMAFGQELTVYDQYIDQKREKESNWQLGFQESLQNFADQSKNLYALALEQTTGLLNAAEQSISSNFMSMLDGTKSVGDAFKDMARGMGQAVIQALVDMAAQWLVYQAVQFAVGKTTQASGAAALTANAQATSLQAGLAAFASTAAIPIVGPLLAPAAMASALAVTQPLAAAVGLTSLSGMAHDGIDSIPATGTWLLEKGERVTTANTSAKMDAVLERIDARQRGGGSSSDYKSQAPIVNLIENSERGGQVEITQDDEGNYSTNVFVRSIRSRGEEARALETTYGLTRVGR